MATAASSSAPATSTPSIESTTATGAITWKLAGSSTAQSLNFTKSAYPTNFSGQHYARILSNGTITVQDNGTDAVPERRVRALNISVNLTAHTATILRQVTDDRTKHSDCCGNAIKLATGDWVMAWGSERLHNGAELERSASTHHYLPGPLLVPGRAVEGDGPGAFVPG